MYLYTHASVTFDRACNPDATEAIERVAYNDGSCSTCGKRKGKREKKRKREGKKNVFVYVVMQYSASDYFLEYE